METEALVNTARALFSQEREVWEPFLLAAVYVRAIHTGESPRDIADAAFKALPSSDAWPALRDALRLVFEDGAGEPA